MKIGYPSQEFDCVVAAVCHGVADDEQCRSLHELLRRDAKALDEYILRVEIHSRLLSDEDLFMAQADEISQLAGGPGSFGQVESRLGGTKPFRRKRWPWFVAIAAGFVFAAIGIWRAQPVNEPLDSDTVSSRAVAMLDRSVRAQWNGTGMTPLAGDPLDPGWLNLEAGLAQVVFYKGARIVVEGPAEFQLLTPSHVSIRRGRITAEIPPQSTEFQIDTPQASMSGLGATLGLDIANDETSVQVFEGEVGLQVQRSNGTEALSGGSGVVITGSSIVRRIELDRDSFASLFDFNAESSEELAMRVNHWQSAGERLNRDPSLLARFDFDQEGPSRWKLKNLSQRGSAAEYAAIVGCQWAEGRWPGKSSLEFRNVNDRVRMNIGGEYSALTLAAWVRVQGLDRKLNSLFMCDGFDEGTIHWLIRNDGVIGLTVVGEGDWNYQIVASPPVLTLNRLGTWVHLAVVLDGDSRRVIHYLNGREVDSETLVIKPPYRIGPAELGNWSAHGFPKDDPFMIRNFSGAMDEFCLFGRALETKEIQKLYHEGRPDSDLLVARESTAF